MSFLLTLHSWNRWLIVLVAAVVIVMLAAGWLGKRTFTSRERGLLSAFAGLMDLQFVLGLLLLLTLGFMPRYRMEHAVTMLIAIVLAHLPARWRQSSDELRFRNSLFAVVGSLVVVFLGVTVLPQGW